MKRTKSVEAIQGNESAPSFDMVRLKDAAKIAHVSQDTIRNFFKQGLRGYRHGRIVWVSLRELESFIRAKAARNPTLVGITKPKANAQAA